MRFRLFIGGLFALILIYVIFWFVLAHTARDKIAEWVTTQRAGGTAITYDDLDIGGFPYRLEVTFENVKVEGREGDLVWTLTSPEAVAVAMPWKRNHAILMAEQGELSLTAGDAAAEVFKAAGARASIVLDDRENPARISLTADTFSASGEIVGPQGLTVSKPELHWRAAEEVRAESDAGPADEEDPREPLTWQLATRGETINHPFLGLSPYGETIQKVSAVLELRGSGVGADSTVGTVAAWRDHGGTVELSSLDIHWQEFDAILRGSLTLDQQFRPLGAFTAEVKGYEPIISYLQKAGHIDQAEAETARLTLQAIVSADQDNDGRLSVPITLQAGRLFVGPLPVANLPPLLPPEDPLSDTEPAVGDAPAEEQEPILDLPQDAPAEI